MGFVTILSAGLVMLPQMLFLGLNIANGSPLSSPDPYENLITLMCLPFLAILIPAAIRGQEFPRFVARVALVLMAFYFVRCGIHWQDFERVGLFGHRGGAI